MKKKYVAPQMNMVELKDKICINTTSNYADSQPAGVKRNEFIMDDIELE